MILRGRQLEINYFHQQGDSFREIARKTGKHRDTVKRYVDNPELIGQGRAKVERPSKLDNDEELQATWILDQLRKMGYGGSYSIVRDSVREIKHENRRIAYIRFETEPGQQAQVDFGDFKVIEPNGEEVTLYMFSMVLGYSRDMYCEYLKRCDMPSFLDAHQRAFAHFGGVPKEILYDRMRNVFIRKVAGKTEFTQGLMTLANHYGFNPEVAAAYSPWVKGKVERPMDFIRERFWRGYQFTNLETANRDLMAFLAEKSQRIHGTTKERVCDRFEVEKSFLMGLPSNLCDISERLYRKVHKDCTISVEGCLYEVPHTLVGKKIVVRLKDGILRIFDGDELMATLEQSPVKGKLVQLPGLREAIIADRKMNARKYDHRRCGKAKATRSPIEGKYSIDVQIRPLDVYAAIGGGVSSG
jgi:transposase